MTTKKPVMVTAAVLKEGGKILIAQRKISGSLGGYWEFPGGKLEQGEDPRGCLSRELKEEFNIEASIGEWIISNIHAYDHITVELHSYWAEHSSGHFELNDHDAIAWIFPEELTDYIMAPADLPTVEKILEICSQVTTHQSISESSSFTKLKRPGR